MKSALQAMALPTLLARWRSLDNRELWVLVTGIFALYFLLLNLLTQPIDEVLNLLLVLGGAVLVFNPPPPTGSPGRGASGAGLGWPCWWRCCGAASAWWALI